MSKEESTEAQMWNPQTWSERDGNCLKGPWELQKRWFYSRWCVVEMVIKSFSTHLMENWVIKCHSLRNKPSKKWNLREKFSWPKFYHIRRIGKQDPLLANEIKVQLFLQLDHILIIRTQS